MTFRLPMGHQSMMEFCQSLDHSSIRFSMMPSPLLPSMAEASDYTNATSRTPFGKFLFHHMTIGYYYSFGTASSTRISSFHSGFAQLHFFSTCSRKAFTEFSNIYSINH